MTFLASQPGQKTSDNKLEKIHRYRETSDGKLGVSILHVAIQGQHFETALALLDLDETLADDNDNSEMSCLQLLANMPHAFASTNKLGFWKSILYYCLPVSDIKSITRVNKMDETQERPQDLESGAPVEDQRLDEVEIIDIDDDCKASKTFSFWRFLFQERPNMGKVWRQERMHKLAFKLAKFLIRKDDSWRHSLTEESSTNFRGTKKEGGGHKEDQKSTANKQDKQTPAETSKLEESEPPESSGQPAGGEIALLTAARNGIIEIVEEMLDVHPQAIEHYSHMRQNILHVVVLHRQKKIFDVAKKKKMPMTNLVEGIDKKGYSILHCAADMTYYSGGTRPGPAYQLQEEIKWYTRVLKIVPPHFVMHHNDDNKTAKGLFDEQHKEQLKEAQRWIKGTAQSCSTVAVLVATVVFAAAYTVPGGSNERGLPNFLDSPMFLFFTIMDVVSLAGSLTAVVSFLSILSSPLELSNFYKNLPRKLTFGFTILFLSVATTMLAFTATILLVIRLEPRRWTSTLIYTAAFFPVGTLALTQFPLYVAFMDTLMNISKVTRKILPLKVVRRLFSTRSRSTWKNRAL